MARVEVMREGHCPKFPSQKVLFVKVKAAGAGVLEGPLEGFLCLMCHADSGLCCETPGDSEECMLLPKV